MLESPFQFTKVSKLSLFDIFRSRKYKDGKAVARALEDYPLYSPPFPGRVRSLKKRRANFEFFMAEKPKRVEMLQEWLLKHFEAEIDMSQEGIEALDGWLFRYAGYLVPKKWISGQVYVFHDHTEPWTGPFAGFNVIHDTGILLGDYLCSNFDYIKWGLCEKDRENDKFDDPDYMRPILKIESNSGRSFSFNIMYKMENYSEVKRDILYNVIHTVRYQKGEPRLMFLRNQADLRNL